MSDDIIDRIDSLVDEQLANYANRSGYDRNVNQDRCWHCGGEWHGLAITEKIVDMRSRRTFDEDYRYAEDDSRVICPGSDFVGPLPTPPWIFAPAGRPTEVSIRGLPGMLIPTIDLAAAGFQPVGFINGDDQ